MIEFQEAPLVKHMDLINTRIKKVGDSVLYPWGSNDHQLYIDLWHKEKGYWLVTVYDFGAGRSGEAIREHYRPLILEFTSKAAFTAYINNLIRTQNQEPSVELYNKVLGFSRKECRECLPEKAQVTNNCVVKNLLAAAKQDAAGSQGDEEGAELFKSFYLSLIRESLLVARQNIVTVR